MSFLFRIILVGSLVLGLTFTYFVNAFMESRAYSIERRDFITASQLKINAIKNVMEKQIEDLEIFKAFFNSSDYISKDEFESYANVLLQNNSSIQSLSWVRNTMTYGYNRHLLDSEMSSMHSIDNNYTLVYESLFQANKKNAKNSLHLDDNQLKFLLDTGYKTTPFMLPSKRQSNKLNDILVAMAVRWEEHSNFMNSSGNVPVRGFIISKINFSFLIAHALKNISSNKINITLKVEGSTIDPIITLRQKSSIEQESLKNKSLTYQESISFLNTDWIVIAEKLNQSHPNSHIDIFIKNAIYIIGTVLSFLITALIYTLFMRHFTVIAEVAEKTQKLNTANQKIITYSKNLENEVEKRTEELKATKIGLEDANQVLRTQSALLLLHQVAFDEHAIISITDAKGYITYANQKFEIISQYSHNELLGKNHRILKSGFHPESFYKQMWKEISSGNIWQGQIKNKAKDGSFYWVESTIVPFLQDEEKPQMYFAIRTDITNQKAAEMELEISRERFVVSQHFANIGTWDWNLVTNELYWSDQLFLLFGLNKNEVEITLDHFTNALHPDDLDMVLHSIDKSLTLGDDYKVEHRIVMPDNSIKWLSEQGNTVRNDDGKPIQMLGITQDITLIREHSNELERAHKAKSDFLSSMSHELRTPLNAILGFAQLLESDTEQPLTVDQKEAVGMILMSGNHLLNLIKGVLELSAIEAGSLNLTIEPLLIGDIINDSLLLLKPLASNNNIQIHILSDLVFTINADRTKLVQIIINLVTNAIKYNHENGSVKIDWKKSENNTIRITIADTGYGISEANKHKLFIAFNRLGREKSTIEGTGIGLVVTKELVELMSGRMGFDSVENKGSTFWFELPIPTEVA